MLFLSMLLVGAMIGFVGAGGAGVTIAVLTAGFHVPIHTALAVALAAMVFTTLSGAVSHFREKEVLPKTALVIGISGVLGAILGASVSNIMDTRSLHSATSWMMGLSAFILYMKLYHAKFLERLIKPPAKPLDGKKLYILGFITGICNGFLSAAFGIGAAAFIQITLLLVFGVPLMLSIGTCMAIILPISASGGLVYLFNGRLDFMIFIQTLAGLMIGAYIGAKGTHLAPLPILKFFIVAVPATASFVLFLNS